MTTPAGPGDVVDPADPVDAAGEGSDGAATSRRRPDRLDRALARLSTEDRQALGTWAVSRLGMLVLAMTTGWLFYRTSGDVKDVTPFLDRWMNWDAYHFRAIAEVWYEGRPTGVPLEAFFPGFPFTLWVLDALPGVDAILAGLVVSAVAGAVAMVALRRLGDLELGPGHGNRAVLLLVLAPPAVFLAAPYTEALFLGLAIPCWLAARRGHWPLAALLCAGASTTRVSGLFLGAALVVEFLTSRHRDWRKAPWLALSFTTPALYMAYLWHKTGDPLRWLHAQEEGWYRTFTWPWQTLQNTWDGAFARPDFSPDYGWQFRAEIIAVAVGVALTAGLLVWRRWGEATWIGLQLVAFTTSYWFFSVPRSTLLWWPLWLALAAITLRWRWTFWVYLGVAAPVMAVWATAYLAGGVWTG